MALRNSFDGISNESEQAEDTFEKVVPLKTKKKKTRRVWAGVLKLIGLVILIAGFCFFIWDYYNLNKMRSGGTVTQEQLQAQQQIKEITEKAGKLMMLPKGEEPIVATITDAAALAKEQAFYSGAKNGDVVLIYQKAMKAVVYSPERNIIVNSGPVYTQPEEAQTTATTTKK
jgi:hypothetical protein